MLDSFRFLRGKAIVAVCVLGVVFCVYPCLGPNIEVSSASEPLACVVGVVSSGTVRVRSTGLLPLQVDDVRTDGTCIIIDAPEKKLLWFGQQLNISYQIDPIGYQPGSYTNSIFVRSNDQRIPLASVDISFSVSKPIEPDRNAITGLTFEPSLVKEVTLSGGSGDATQVYSFATDTNLVEVLEPRTPFTLSEGQEQTVQLRIHACPTQEVVEDRLTIFSRTQEGHKEYQHRLPVRVLLADEAIIQPSQQVVFGRVEVGSEKKKAISVWTRKEARHYNVTAQCQAEAFQVKEVELHPNEILVHLSFSPTVEGLTRDVLQLDIEPGKTFSVRLSGDGVPRDDNGLSEVP